MATNNLFTPEGAIEWATTHSGKQADAERILVRVRDSGSKLAVESAYATWAALKSGLPNKRAAEVLNKGASTITLYRRCGAYLIAGGDSTGPVWSVLSSKSKANDAKHGVTALLDADVVDVAAVDKHILATYDSTGKVKAPASPADGQPNVEGQTLLDEARKALKALGVTARKMDSDTFAIVETEVTNWLKRELDTRVKAAAEAAKDESKVA